MKKTFKEIFNEGRRLPNQDLEGVEADKIMRDLESRPKETKIQSHSDEDGYQIDFIMDKQGNSYIAYYGYNNDLMRLVVNPNSKQKSEFKNSI